MIQPIDHKSQGAPYSSSPNKISGDLYHIVTTSCVYGLCG